MKKVAVVGSGIAGIAVAIRLKTEGYDVRVFEKNKIPGGKISEFTTNGYRFDTGPSLFTLPEMVNELFEISGKDASRYLPYSKLDIVCRYFYPDGTIIDSYKEPEKFAKEIEKKTSEPASHVSDHLNTCRELYQKTAGVFIFSNFHKIKNYFTPPYRKTLFYLHRMDFFLSLHQRHSRTFKNKKIVQLFDRYATYNGSNPYQAPATLKMIAHLEHNTGAFFPANGMYSIVKALHNLALELGVVFEMDTLVDEISIEKNKATGLIINGEKKMFDIVVSDVDVNTLYRKLLKGIKIPITLKKAELSSSAIVFYWGIKKQDKQILLHNIFFSGNYKAEFEAIFKKKCIPDDPTVYLFVSNKHTGKDAPEACENWFAMINVPANHTQNWDLAVAQARERILKKLTKELGYNPGDWIESEIVTDPRSIEESTASYAGALYGPASNSRMAAFLRHPNQRNKIKNLYFVGGSVHPGGGIPLCLASAKIVAGEIMDLKKE